MATTLTRSNQSTTIKKVDNFTFGDWAGNFTYDAPSGSAPTSIQINATKGQHYLNGNISLTSPNVSFSGGPFDAAVVSAVINEANTLLTPAD